VNRHERSELYQMIRNIMREDLINNLHARAEAMLLLERLPEDSEKAMYFRRKLHNRINML